MAIRRYNRLPEDVRRRVIAMGMQGRSYRQIIATLDVSTGTIVRTLAPLGGVIRKEWWEPVSPNRLCLDDRIEIWHALKRGDSYARIGASLDRPRHKSTICREVNANGGRAGYRPVAAEKRAITCRRRPKATKLATNPALAAIVTERLSALWSPEQIAAHLRGCFGDDQSMTVSHETIYKSLYVQGRGELRRELTRCLRTGRTRRLHQGRTKPNGQIRDMVMIAERPAEVEDRAVPGHWEGDLILGKDGESAVATLVERTTRYVMVLRLEGDRRAETVRDAMTTAILCLPAHLRRSLTWDQGSEMAQHVRFSVDTDVAVFFCDPHSPWQRGTNENTNGLLRQYLPKGTDLSVHSQADLDAIAHSLNTRPRKTLSWATPADELARLVATTG